MEENETRLSPTRGEFVSFVREVTDSFKDLAERKKYLRDMYVPLQVIRVKIIEAIKTAKIQHAIGGTETCTMNQSIALNSVVISVVAKLFFLLVKTA